MDYIRVDYHKKIEPLFWFPWPGPKMSKNLDPQIKNVWSIWTASETFYPAVSPETYAVCDYSSGVSPSLQCKIGQVI